MKGKKGLIKIILHTFLLVFALYLGLSKSVVIVSNLDMQHSVLVSTSAKGNALGDR